MIGILVLLLLAEGPSWRGLLPDGAVVVETARVPSRVRPGRLLVLWMADARRDGRTIGADEPYTCPDETRGSRFLSGRAAISLVDLARGRVIQTVSLDPPDDPVLDLPLRIRRGLYATRSEKGEARPLLLRLRDFTGDGRKLEFALFQKDSCSLTWGTVLGYDEIHDRVVWYEVHLRVLERGESKEETLHWVEGLFQTTGGRHARWVFVRGYPEETPRRYAFDVHFDSARGWFEGTETITPGDPPSDAR